MQPLSTHTLRHTTISRWIAAGLDPKIKDMIAPKDDGPKIELPPGAKKD